MGGGLRPPGLVDHGHAPGGFPDDDETTYGITLMDSTWREAAAAYVLDELIQELDHEPPGLRDLLMRALSEWELAALVRLVSESPTSGRWASLSTERQSSGILTVAIRMRSSTDWTAVIDFRVQEDTGRADVVSLLPRELFPAPPAVGETAADEAGTDRRGTGDWPDIAAARDRRARSRRGDAMLTRRRTDLAGRN